MSEPAAPPAATGAPPAVRGGGGRGGGRGGGSGFRGGRGRGGGGINGGGAPLKQQPNGGGAPHVAGAGAVKGAAKSATSGGSQESEETRTLRQKHGAKLKTIKELFPEWSDEDLLQALSDSNGDLELSIGRISEGHAQQWGSVKTKKDKKAPTPAGQPSSGAGFGNGPQTSSTDARPHRGGADTRGRGRGDFRGGRGGARGGGLRGGIGRGAFQNTARQVNGSSKGPNTAAGATSTPTSWADEPIETTTTETAKAAPGWGDEPAPEAPAAPAAEAEDSAGWGSAAPAAAAAAATPTEEAPAAQAPKMTEKNKHKVIPMGTKMSWAQIARPVEPPKPVVPPPAPAAAPASAAPAVPAAAVSEPQPQITIPEPTDDVWNATPAAAAPSAGAAAPSVWNDEPQPQPLGGVGEGWAETVLARQQQQPASVQTQTEGAAPSIFEGGALTPSDANKIAPLEIDSSANQAPSTATSDPSAPSGAAAQDQATQTPSAAAAPAGANTGSAQAGGLLAPPGLAGKRSASSRAAKGIQDQAVVMPPGGGTPGVGGLQFGSLSLFDQGGSAPSAPVFGTFGDAPEDTKPEALPEPPQPAAPPALEQPKPSVPSQVHQLTEDQSTGAFGAPQAQYGQPVQPPQQQLYGQPQQPTSAFASRYPATTTQYSAPEPSLPSQQQVPVSAPAATQQHHDAFSQSPYARYSQQTDPMAAYFSQQQAASQPQQAAPQPQQASQQQPQAVPSPAPQQPSQQQPQQQQGGYGGFNPMQQPPQAQHQHQQPPTQSQAQNQFGQTPYSAQDYSALYGQEALRSLGYYDSYSHAQAAQAAAFQNRSPHPPEDASKQGQGQTAGPQGQQQQQPQQTQQPPSAAQQYPGLAPGMPYPYYPYYGQYGQMPGGYQNPAYPYGMQAAPYYSNQYAASAARSGYPIQQAQQSAAQPGGAQQAQHQQPVGGHGSHHSLGGYRQPGLSQTSAGGGLGGLGGQQQQAQQQGTGGPGQPGAAQQYASYGGYGAGGGYGDSRQSAGQTSGGPTDRKDAFSFSSDRFFAQ